MGRKTAKNTLKINQIKEITKNVGASSRLISLWVDVDYTTVSGWNSNTSQPNYENLNEIGELLEEDNGNLLASQGRKNTGLAKALENELQRLRKEEGLPYEIEQLDKKKGVKVKVNNPKLIRRLREFAEAYKKK
ncbi:hypothetical protein FFJ24_010570 [Pedobacter sp. KBS0701]|uniref:hypothetical protein n=1 Tax=Pedobacter sp. KBS0701 TaxID=2578106 RepID=UPI00110ED2EF|nr:hypothetical protein [Pedobacter sp. KBS0701]QDW25230.1 hypothetical protein FFJ24_010570 [Pedobacter sp. KBS0701]